MKLQAAGDKRKATVGALNASGDVSSADFHVKSASVVQRQEDLAIGDRYAGQNLKVVGAENSLFVRGVSDLNGNQSSTKATNFEATIPLNTTGDQTFVVISASGAIFDRASAIVCNGPAVGKNSGEAGQQTSKGQGKSIVQNLVKVKEIGAGQEFHFSGKSGAIEAGDKEQLSLSSRDLTLATEQNVVANIDAADLLKFATKTSSKNSGWSMVNKTQSSPSKINGQMRKNLATGTEKINVANSFGVLENAPVLVDARMGEQQVDQEETSNTGQPKTPGSVKEQQKHKPSGARSVSPREVIATGEQKAVAEHVDHDLASTITLSNSPYITKQQ